MKKKVKGSQTGSSFDDQFVDSFENADENTNKTQNKTATSKRHRLRKKDMKVSAETNANNKKNENKENNASNSNSNNSQKTENFEKFATKKQKKQFKKALRSKTRKFTILTVALWTFALFIAPFAFVEVNQYSSSSQSISSVGDQTFGETEETKCYGARAVYNLDICETPYGKEDTDEKFDCVNFSKMPCQADSGQMGNSPGTAPDEDFFKRFHNEKWEAQAHTYGFKDSSSEILLVGNSHSGMLAETIGKIAKNNGYRLDNVWTSAIHKDSGAIRFEGGSTCLSSFDNRVGIFHQFDLIDDLYYNYALKSKYVIISAYQDDLNQSYCNLWNLPRVVQFLSNHNIKPLVLQDMFSDEETYKKCQKEQTEENCSLPKEEALKIMNAPFDVLNKAGYEDKYTKVSTEDLYCDLDRCHYNIGKMPIGSNYLHLNRSYSESEAPFLNLKIAQALGHSL